MSDRQLRFSESELLSDYGFATPHRIGDQRLHGGFDAEGAYIPPRSKGRRRAIDNWTAELRERGGDLLEADSSLLTGPRVPNYAQQCLLIENGVTRPFWNGLTITGKIEGRGRMIAQMPLPDLRSLIVEDIGDMAIGHLGKGSCSRPTASTKGGEPDKGIGGHDVMWFVARDLAFGPSAHPDVEPPGAIARPEADGKTPGRRMPQIELPYEMLLGFLMNLLLDRVPRGDRVRQHAGDPAYADAVHGPARRSRRSGDDRRANPHRRARSTSSRCGSTSASCAQADPEHGRRRHDPR